MYASGEKKIDILNDHYKDTFSHLVSYRKQRDRLLLYLLGAVTILFLYQFFPDEVIDVIFKAVSAKLEVDIVLSSIEKIMLIIIPLIVFLTILSRRYWQVWNLIESQYDYLEKLETELASLYASGVPFTRESKFSFKGQRISLWNHGFYNQIFLSICMFIFPVLGSTFGIRHYGFSWRLLIVGLMGPIIFFTPGILRWLNKRN